VGIYRRPPTFCAHRLRRPNRTCETSDALCRATPPRLAGSNPHLQGRRRRRETPSAGSCRARYTRLAACLRRRAPTAPERLPSVRSGSRDPAGEVAFVVHSRFLASHPVARLEPRLPRQRPVGRFELSRLARLVTGCPAPRRAGEKDASLRLLQPTHDTSTLYAARFPLSLPSCLTALRPRGPPARDGPSMTRPTRACALTDTSTDGSTGRASLDGEPPASALPQPASQLSRAGALDRRLLRASHGLVGASIERSSALCFPNVTLSTTRRACSSASDALCRDAPASPGLSVGSALDTARLLLRRRLVKDSNFVETRTPSIDEVALFTHRVRVRTSPARAGELDR